MVRISAFLFLLFATFGVMTFFMSLYLHGRGLDTEQIGTIMACGSLVSMLAQPFWGYVSDRRKTIKRVLMMLLVLCFASSMGMFSARGVLPILALYVLFMFFYSAVGPLSETLCISYTYQNRIEYGRVRLWGELGVAASTLLLGFIVQRIGTDWLWLIYAIMLSLAIGAAVFVRDSQSTPVPVDLASLGALFSRPRLLWFLFLVLLLAIPHKMNDSMLAIYLSQLGAGGAALGLAWLMATGCSAVGLLFVDRLFGRRNEFLFFIAGAFFYVLRWYVYSQANSPGVLIAAQGLHGLTFTLFFVASIRYMRRIVPPELVATGQAAFAVTYGGFGGIIGNAGGGVLIKSFGMQTAYTCGSLLALTGAIAAIGTLLYNHRRGLPPVLTDTATAHIDADS